MKRWLACISIAFGLVLPTVSDAHGHRGDRDDRSDYDDRGDHRIRENNHGRGDHYNRADSGYRDDRDRYDDHDRHRRHNGDPIRFIGHVIALPFQVTAAVIGAAVDVVSAPLYPRRHYAHAQPAQGYDGPAGDYYERDERDERHEYYEGSPGRVYSASPDYYPPQPIYRGY